MKRKKETLPQQYRVTSMPSFRFISIWMLLLIIEASMRLSNVGISVSCKQEHTHNDVSLASFWGEWTLNSTTSWPPWNPAVPPRSTKKKLSAPSKPGDVGTVSSRGCQLFLFLALRCFSWLKVWLLRPMLFCENLSFMSQWKGRNNKMVGGGLLCAVCLLIYQLWKVEVL